MARTITAVFAACSLAASACSRTQECPRLPNDESTEQAAYASMKQSQDASLVRFQISAVQVPATGAPAIRATFRNETWDSAVWLRHAIGFLKAAGDGARLDVTDAEGRPVRPNCKVKNSDSALLPSAYTLLTPQAEISTVVGLGCYDLRPGHYRATAHFHDDAERPALLRGATWFRGTLVSNTIELNVASR